MKHGPTPTPEPEAGVPGASARCEYDRRRAQREDHARSKLGPAGVLVARVVDEPQHTTAWKTGAAGEGKVGARLEKLLRGTEVKLLHDRRMPGSSRANIDHINVGPGRVTVIDTKNIKGKLRVDRVGGLFTARHDVLLVNGRDKTSLVESVEKQVEAVRRALLAAGHEDIDVRGALCLADVGGLPLMSTLNVRGTMINGPKPIAKLARQSGPLTAAAVETLWVALTCALPAA
jgi:hypothetical protein